MKWALAVPLVGLVSAGCFFGGEPVTRVYSGREVRGPFITPEAYAHYAQAALEERRGQWTRALSEYRAAASEDDSSPDVWTRIGALQCRVAEDPSESFARAEALDREYAPLARERARCALARGDLQRALSFAERAVALDPDDESASLLVAGALTKLGRLGDAKRWLFALALCHPGSSEALRAYTALEPVKNGERALAPDPLGARRAGTKRPVVADVDRALRAGDAERARRLATSAGMRPRELALRAAALGLTPLARQEAERILAADPGDSDALVALAVSANLDGDAAARERALSDPGRELLEPSPLAVRLFAELIARRLGASEARAWLDAWALAKPSDPLEAEVERRSQRQ